MIDVAVNIPVRKQSYEVQRFLGRTHSLRRGVPHITRKQAPRINRIADQLRALVKNSTGAESVVPYFAVAHVGVVRHPNPTAVGDQVGRRRGGEQMVKVRRARKPHRV